MDGRAFDDFSRDLAAAKNRRGLLVDFGGGALASILGGFGLSALMASEAIAKKKKKKKKKKGCQGDSCGTGKICVEGICVTGAGTCPQGANVCGESPFSSSCNGNDECFCFQSVTGATRCASAVSACGTCTSHADCATFGTGAVCAVAPVAACNCTAGQGFCIKPCAT